MPDTTPDPVTIDPSEPDLTHRNKALIAAILDRSGSMKAIAADTIGGFNQFLEDQKKVPVGAEMTVILFDDLYEVPVPITDIQNVPVLTPEVFVPRGWTALYDAIGKTVRSLNEHLAKIPDDERPSKVVVVIMTDGVENRSQEFNLRMIQDLIDTQKKASWEFIFLGANLDAVAVGAGMGINRDQALHYAFSGGGTKKALSAVSREMASYRCSARGAGGQSAMMAFSQEDRDAQAAEGLVTPPPVPPAQPEPPVA